MIAAFVHHAVTVKAATNSDSGRFRRICGDKFRIWHRTKTHCAGNIFRRNHLQDLQPIFAVSHEREFRRIDRADLHRARVIQFFIGVVKPFELRLFGIGNVNERQAIRAIGDVSVSPREIKPLRIAQRHECTGNQLRLRRFGDIENFEAFIIRHERVTELHANRARIFQTVGQFARQHRCFQRIITQANNEQTVFADNVKIRSRHEALHRAGKFSIRIETDDFFLVEKVVVRIAIEQRADRDHHQTFFAVGHKNPRVNRTHRLLHIFRQMCSQWINAECARQRDARGVFGADVSALAERRNRRGADAFGKAFLINVGNVKNLKAVFAICGVKIFAALN